MVTTITGHHAKIRFFFDIAVSSKQKKALMRKGLYSTSSFRVATALSVLTLTM